MFTHAEDALLLNECESCPYSRCTQSKSRMSGSTPRLVFGAPDRTCALIDKEGLSEKAIRTNRHGPNQCPYKRWMEKPPNM